MNAQITGLRVAAALFGVMSLLQLSRLLLHVPINVAGHLLPLWPSGLAFALLAMLSLWLWRLSCAAAH